MAAVVVGLVAWRARSHDQREGGLLLLHGASLLIDQVTSGMLAEFRQENEDDRAAEEYQGLRDQFTGDVGDDDQSYRQSLVTAGPVRPMKASNASLAANCDKPLLPSVPR